MASRKEDEKNEKIIRGLTKLPENRKCINCGSLGPQYVCTNFSIFICTTCSGLHREFTHRVKSISMATFTSSEVAALQAGGNQRARDMYFKEWDSSRHSLPDSSNPDKLRDFIKAVYVERRFSGRGGRLSDAEDVHETRRPDRFRYGQSPSFEDQYGDRRYSTNRSGSRGSDRGFDDKMSPARFEDRRYEERDRRFEERDRRPDEREARRYEDRDRNDDRRFDDRDRRYDDRERRFDYGDRERRSDDPRDSRNTIRRPTSDDWDSRRPSKPSGYRGGETPPLRSVRDILGEDVPKLRVEDGNVRSNGRLEDESPRSVSSQGDGRLRSSKSLDVASSNGSSKALQYTVSESLIDFAAEPESSKVSTQFDPFGTAPVAEQPNASKTQPFDPFGTSEQPKASTTQPFDPFATSEQPKSSSQPFDLFSTTEAPKSTAAADPFAQPGGVSTGWASFDLSPPKVSTAPTSFFDQTVNPAQQVKTNTDWPPQQSSVMHAWTSSGVQPAPSFQDQWNQAPQTQIPQPRLPHPPLPQQQQQQPQVQHQNQLPAENGLQKQPSRPEIPENLFSMPQMPPYGGMQMHMPLPFGFMPQGPPFAGAVPAPIRPMPPYLQPPQSKSNPFEEQSPSSSSPFANMNALHNALPTFNGLQSTPTPPWSQPGFAGGPPPGSYPPASYQQFPAGGFNPQLAGMPNAMPHNMQGQFQPTRPSPGVFMNGASPFNASPPAASSNPFG